MAVDLSFSTSKEHFNVRSAAIIRQHDHILCTSFEGLGFWFLPGGRPKRGETSVEGLKREFREELNAKIEVDAPHIIAESFFDLHDERYHELALYYVAECPPEVRFVTDQDCHTHEEEGRIYRYRWIELNGPTLKQFDLQPRALHAHFIDLPPLPLHIVFEG
ncbi:NUDIX hydrolase [Maritalea mediterranea]|uniref:NUDIX domain-containing protein n=1 Tax=Maritalea mediterranea TaxID=2909667 RepID=A0ABS9E9Z0_9HYPH|nr:NUDIX domain-containing protein [Maritalea mediterranea]MCF4099683.1 NUDIX domain-containing protein [Maritalea mediterranea]